MTQPANNTVSPLAEKMRILLRESRWLLLVAVALYLILVLYGYDRADSAWSHSASKALETHNPGGLVGAWLSDLIALCIWIFRVVVGGFDVAAGMVKLPQHSGRQPVC
jgi:DNA segregation ATPase FtsK/SpoIIIE-like protein